MSWVAELATTAVELLFKLVRSVSDVGLLFLCCFAQEGAAEEDAHPAPFRGLRRFFGRDGIWQVSRRFSRGN